MGADPKSSLAQPSSQQPGRSENLARRRRQADSPASTTAPAAAVQPVFAASRLPTHDEIGRRAFAIYEAEGRPQGRAAEHWRMLDRREVHV